MNIDRLEAATRRITLNAYEMAGFIGGLIKNGEMPQWQLALARRLLAAHEAAHAERTAAIDE